jgi:hypothetical protein
MSVSKRLIHTCDQPVEAFGACRSFENADFLLACSHPADKTLLGFIQVSG